MSPAGPEVVTLGECLVSFVASEPGPLATATAFRAYPAGAEANVAVGLARLGRRVAFVGRVGADGLGTRILRALRGEGVDVSGLVVDPAAPTGVMIRERRGIGPAEVFYARAGSAGSRLAASDVSAAEARGDFATARWLHLTGITPALSPSCRAAIATALETGRAAGLTVSLDLNLRRRLWTELEAATILAELAARVDVVIADEDEARVVTGASRDALPETLAAALLALGPALVALKLGSRGSLGLERGASPAVVTGAARARRRRSGRGGRCVLRGVHRGPSRRAGPGRCPRLGERVRSGRRRRRGRPDRPADRGRAGPPARGGRTRHAPLGAGRVSRRTASADGRARPAAPGTGLRRAAPGHAARR